MPDQSLPSSPRVRRATADRHFDGLADKFERGFYSTERGQVRLELTRRLLEERFANLPAGEVLEIGAGLGQTALWWLTHGHQLTLVEPSVEMRERAQQRLAESAEQGILVESDLTRLAWSSEDLQGFAARTERQWPVVVCHAVLEWLIAPQQGFALLAGLLAPGGVMSLSVFNRDALAFSNVTKGNFDKTLEDRLAGWGTGKRLTPISPLRDTEIRQWASDAGLEVRELTGLRVFHDYLRSREPLSSTDMEKLLELESRHWRTPPFVYLGRYLHYELVRPA